MRGEGGGNGERERGRLRVVVIGIEAQMHNDEHGGDGFGACAWLKS